MTQQLWTGQRHHTAIGRVGLSLPARRAVGDLQLEPATGVLDYRCGRGGDVRAFRHLGRDATGWDPVHFPDGLREVAEVVLLTYVLDVIEDPAERRDTLLSAWELTKSVLVVSARLRWERNQIKGTEYGDGILTDDAARLSYLACQVAPDGGWLASEDAASAITSVVAHLEQRGRMPQLEEMPQPTIRLLDHLRPGELKRLAEQEAESGAPLPSPSRTATRMGRSFLQGTPRSARSRKPARC
ncbi:DNA phosphorothioation-associated putative methyltransferase [Streptomyces sp. NPDC051597]|uniref:DNA phosphorothioation-associated putative methyltransferase n=1 Tax=Streptomyces sp. NPDC051597 TaxID=3155049 RepID=UPI0034189E78